MSAHSEAPDAVKRLSEMIFGGFDQAAWDATAWAPFASLEEINRCRGRLGDEPLDPEQYQKSRAEYYKAHPSARRIK